MSVRIKIELKGTSEENDKAVKAMIAQDPMGDLETPVTIKIGTSTFRGFVVGYVSGGADRQHCETRLTIQTVEQ